MTKFIKIASLIITITFYLGITSFSDQTKNPNNKIALDNIKKQYKIDFEEFAKATQILESVVNQYSNRTNKVNEKLLQDQVKQTRLAYKKIEFLLEYLDPEITLKYINGAPLPKLMKHVPEITVIEPNGLQTIDEVAFLSPEEGKTNLEKLTYDLKKIAEKVRKYQLNKKLEYRFVVEAVRYGVLRVFTLGLTGFDTPGSGNAIAEAVVSMQSMMNSLIHYQSVELKDGHQQLSQIVDLFSQSIKYIDSQDFESLDRLYFLTEFADPLYSLILDFQHRANIESKKEVDQSLYPHNYESKHIFGDDFFNPAYYTQIAESDLIDEKKIALGKLLFYDPVMSKDLNMSCASCHNPNKGFADGLPKAKTTQEGVFTDRHSPTLINSALYGRYFWDMREYDLERQIKHVVHNELEFNIDFLELVDRLKSSTEYIHMFENAYGDRDKYKISTWSISNSLAAYVNSLTSYNSTFDKYARGETKTIDDNVRKGFNLFMGKAACGTCHFAPSFSGLVPPFYSDSESEVLGITTEFDTITPKLDNDPGRVANGLADEEAEHYHRSIKTVTVRNTGITAPYMHNGSLNTLEEVLHFYNKGGGAGLGLDIDNQTLPSDHLDLSVHEMNNIIRFMESLTDTIGMVTYPTPFPEFENNPEWNNRASY